MFKITLKLHTKLEDIAQPSVRVSEVVETDLVWHVVAVEPLPEVREPDGVLDEDSVLLRACDEWFLVSQE